MYKPGQFVKYYFIGIEPKRYKLLLIDSIVGSYYRYKISIQLPKLKLTTWDYSDHYSFKHIHSNDIFRDKECIKMERKFKLQFLFNTK